MPVGLLGKQNKCKQLLLLLSLDAHNHIDDYFGTLEGVRNYFYFLNTHCTVSFSKKKERKKKKVTGQWKTRDTKASTVVASIASM